MSQMTTKKITRRDFMRKAGRGGIIIAGIGSLPGVARSSDADFTAHQKETMECIADTAVPPTFEEDEWKPGAAEARAWELMNDPFYEVSRFIPYITWDIDIFCYLRYGMRFVDLDYDKREQVLLDREVRGGPGGTLAPAYRMTINIAKIAFFGGVINRVGTDYVGFTYEWWR